MNSFRDIDYQILKEAGKPVHSSVLCKVKCLFGAMLVNSLINLSRSFDPTEVRGEDISLVVPRNPTCLDTGLFNENIGPEYQIRV